MPDYGKLSGRSVDDMIAGARVEVAPFKEDPMDFVLWKPSSGREEPGWDSPWGRGRPGWHIECSAMSHELLGPVVRHPRRRAGPAIPPPRERNRPKRCAHPHGSTSRIIWLHNEMLQVEGKKMSKSLGNFFTVRDLLDQGIPGEVIRFVYLMTHYRKPMDWTAEKAHDPRPPLPLRHHAARRPADPGRPVLDRREGPDRPALDALGVDHIEGGWPGANPTDSEFFAAPPATRATLTAFGMTKRVGRSAENDDVLAAVLNAGHPRGLPGRQDP
jgi:cysteinyl-tRNA synthetase